MEDQLTALLNELWASTIKKYDFNILKNTISFELKTIDMGHEAHHQLIFEGVSAWYYVENIGARRFITKDDEDYYLELTSIDFYKRGIGEIKPWSISEEWANQYYANANFALEIWSSLLLIEAKSVVINGNRFEVGLI